MEKKALLTADILDILFEHRNKAYGAYELRMGYNKRIQRAMGIMLLICLLAFAGMLLANRRTHDPSKLLLATDVRLEKVEEPQPEPEQPKPEPKPEKPPVATEVLTPPKIVEDDLVKEEEIMKVVDEYENVKIGTVHTDGAEDDGLVDPPVEKTGTGIAAPAVGKLDVDGVFTTVEIKAEFPGGLNAWYRFLEKNLNADIPNENGAPAAKYTVIVSFIVDREGKVSDVKAENDPGYGTKEEAIRVIKKGPDWIPASQNGSKVIYRHKQSITFSVVAD